MNSLVNQVSQINSYGVTLLASGDRSNAMIAFRRALQTLNDASTSYNLLSSSEIFAPTKCKNPTFSTSCILPHPGLNDKEADGDEGQFFVYSHAFHFDASVAMSSSFEVLLSFYSSIIVFNMALAFHLIDNGMNVRAQHKALSMYNVGTNIVKDLENECLNQHAKQCLNSLLIAFLNNKAHIYFGLSDFVKLQQQLSHMRNILTPQDTIVYKGHHIQGFLLNAMFLDTVFVARAA